MAHPQLGLYRASEGRARGPSGVPALLAAQRSVFALHDQARVLAVLSPAFDASLSDLMTAHTSGACLVLPAPGLLQDPNRLLQTLARESITHVDLPPAVVARVDAEQLPSTLECVVMGGEICPPLAARSWARRVRLINVYGPTEATICTSMVQVHPETWTEPDLGTPIPGVLYRVEDEELWIGGDCLAHGYTDAQLTEQCFTHRDGQRWYRTRDRVERIDGRWIFRGRLDRMVKLQGRLAHPEELEEVLMAHPAVTRAAAWAQAGRLHCAVVGGEEALLREWVRARLPMWMQPATVCIRRSLPQTPSGKIDTQALERSPATADQWLPALWSQALGRPVGEDDDLDALGRDSFSVLEVCSLAEQVGLSFSPEQVLRATNCRELAAATGQLPLAVEQLRERLPVLAKAEPRAQAPPERLLLTGATGTLGRVLLPTLLAAGVEIWALCRDPSRLPRHPRLHGLQGDLTEAELGLSREDRLLLQDRIDTVVHLAADLHSLRSAEDLWATNVEGTAALLHMASISAPKRVHLASTLAIFACSDATPGLMTPQTPLPQRGVIRGGYAQTKWAAEEW